MHDLSQYLPRLDFNVRAQFEPVSGLLILNVDFATFCQAGAKSVHGTATEAEVELESAINHEWYHYFQTIANGYQYEYASEMWRTIVELKRDEGRRSSRTLQELPGVEKAPELAEWKPDIQDLANRMMGMQALAKEVDQAYQWERDPSANDLSVLAAREPELAQAFDKLWANVNLRNAEDLSAMDLIEGSAIVYEHAATYGRDGLEGRLADVWQVHGDMYRRAYQVAEAACGPRALDVILPATALALRYTKPANAFPFFLQRLNSSPRGSELAEARRLADHPPAVDAAGPCLGTASDVRAKQRDRQDRYQIYDEVLDDLAKRGSGVDEIDLMADPAALGKLPSFPVQMVARDVPLRGRLEIDELVRRLQLGNLVLRTSKLPRYRREAQQRLSDRLHAPFAWLIDPRQGADEYAHLAFEAAERGDSEQARLLYDIAITTYKSIGDKQGMANACFSLGVVHYSRNDLKRAEEMYRKSLNLSKALGDPAAIARAAANLGTVYFARKDWDQAEPLIREALAIEERLSLKEGMAIEYFNLGRISQERGDVVQGEELLNKSLKLYEDIGNNLMARAAKGWLEKGRTPQQ